MNLKACDKGRVLIAEDNAATRNLFAVIVSENVPGLNVDLAVNGGEAVSMFKEAHQGVIVMDLYMPVMSGLKTYRQIEEICQKEKRVIPSVIFCTAYAPLEVLDDIIAKNEQHCLLKKPLTGNQLAKAIQQRL